MTAGLVYASALREYGSRLFDDEIYELLRKLKLFEFVSYPVLHFGLLDVPPAAGSTQNIICDVALDGLPEIFYAEANDKQLKWLSPFAKYKVRRIDASLGIWADENTRALTNVDPKRLAAAAAARKPLSKLFMDRAARGDHRHRQHEGHGHI